MEKRTFKSYTGEQTFTLEYDENGFTIRTGDGKLLVDASLLFRDVEGEQIRFGEFREVSISEMRDEARKTTEGT